MDAGMKTRSMQHSENPEARRFRVAVVTYPFHDHVGRVTLSRFIELLAPLSDELVIITGDFPSWPGENVHTIGLETNIHKGPLPIRIVKVIWADLMASFHLLRMSRKFDIVIFHIGTPVHLSSILISKLLRKKVVVCVTGLFSPLARRQYNRAVGAVAGPYEMIRFVLADQIGVESHTVANSPQLSKYRKKIAANWALCVDTDIFKTSRDSSMRENVVAYVGRMVEGKGIMEFVDAIPMILNKRQDVSFLIGGDGPLRDKVLDKLQTSGLAGRVQVRGWIPDDEYPNCLNDIKLLVLPSISEGLPGVVQQAMPCGTVVLATSVGGVPDLIRDEETGFILANNTPDCIASNVLRALSHPRLGVIAENARRLIEQEYGRDAMVEKRRIALDALMNHKR
jgi:glycosyltransferase involved in cell wall biosynthesis